MNLSRDETEVAYNCVAAVMRGFTTAQPPWAVRHLYDRLNAEYRNPSQFRPEHECCCGRGESEPDQLLSSRQVAAMLGHTKQHVNRKAKTLGGVNVDGAWMFRESVIREHIAGRNDV